MGFGGLVAFEAEADLPLELDQAADAPKLGGVVLAAECGEHAGVVAERRDGRAQAALLSSRRTVTPLASRMLSVVSFADFGQLP